MVKGRLPQTAKKFDWDSLNQIYLWASRIHDVIEIYNTEHTFFRETTNITAGSTYTLPNSTGISKLIAAGTLATLTLKMPAVFPKNAILSFRPNFTVTVLTHQANTSVNASQAIAAGDNLSALVANTTYEYYYDEPTWRRI